VHQVGS